MRNPSKITSELEVDEPLLQNAGFAFGKDDRQYLDNQIRGIQKHVVAALIRGRHATYVRVASTSAALAVGDTVCLSSLDEGVPTVTKSTSLALADAIAVFGVVLVAAAPSSFALVAFGGVLPRELTGLAKNAKGYVRVNASTSKCERVVALDTGDYGIGVVDAAGQMLVVPGIGAANTVGGGLIELDGDVTGDPDENVVEGILGYPINASELTENDVLAFDASESEWVPRQRGGGSGSDVTFDGDLSGDETSQTVVGIKNLPIVGDDPGAGQVPRVKDNGVEIQFEAAAEVPDGDEDDVVGLDGSGGLKNLGPMSGGGVELDGDVTGDPDENVVVGIKGYPIVGDDPMEGQVPTFENVGGGQFTFQTPSGGDLPFLPYALITVEDDESAYNLTGEDAAKPRLHIVLETESTDHFLVWEGADDLRFTALVSVYSPLGDAGIMLQDPSAGMGQGAMIMAGESTWVAYNGTRLVRVGSAAVVDPPPDDDPTPPTMLDPATLELTGYLGADYTGTGWTGLASAGSSIGRNASVVNAPAVSTPTYGGDNVPHHDGVNDYFTWGNLGDLIDDYSFCGFIIFKADALDAPEGSALGDAALFGEGAGALAISVSTEGVKGFIQTVAGAKVVNAAASAGVLNFVSFRFDGTTFAIGVNTFPGNSGPSSSIAAGGTNNIESAFRTARLGANYSAAAFFDGQLVRVGISDDHTTISNEQFVAIMNHFESAWGVSFGS